MMALRNQRMTAGKTNNTKTAKSATDAVTS